MADTATAGAASLRGEVVYFFAFDIAYDLRRTGLTSLLGHPVEPFRVDARKRGPRGQVFYTPQMVRLPALVRNLAGGSITLQPAIKVLPAGALSVTVRASFDALSLSDLAAWHDLGFTDGDTLEQWVVSTVESARSAELAAHAVRPHERLPDAETYTVFCIDAASPGLEGPADEWLETHRRSIAALLTKEMDAASLSEQEVQESTTRWLSYYRHDLIVTDWDAALVLDRTGDFDETLYIMELANVQLEELAAYDEVIDTALERAYRDLRGRRSRRRGEILKELKELRIDLARFSDELSNITKFFGEWHLARVYENVSRVFHLADWHRAIDEKLRTLDSLYEMLKQDQNHRVMLWLEASIVLLFIIDLIVIFSGK